MYCKLFKRLPPLPPELEAQVWARVRVGGDEFNPRYGAINYEFFCLDEHAPIRDWVRARVLRELVDADALEDISIGVHAIKPAIKIHKDHERDACLNYLLDVGGEGVRTVFYGEDRATELEAHVIPRGVWHALQTDVFHGVEGIAADRARVALTIGLPKRFFLRAAGDE